MAIQPTQQIRTVPANESGAAQGLFARMFQSFTAARQRKVERDLAEIIARRGGVMAGRNVAGGNAARSTPFHTLPALHSR